MRSIVLNGVTGQARQYIGIGPLRVNTRGGEIKAHSGDWIVTFGEDDVLVMSNLLFAALLSAQSTLTEDASEEVSGGPVDAPRLTSVSTVSSTMGSTSGQVLGLASLDEIKAKDTRGEKLTGEEEMRLLDGK